ncbi:TetR/AcrR family transcriptional regulator [Glutamicibacter sp. NPDC087344]|uniref:TetR/AcrR family transcriptional regulator n=1 Tax=Glutamicibacter sp. NPDC087344 TaxID=3363994 RepID=UPI0037FD2E1F
MSNTKSATGHEAERLATRDKERTRRALLDSAIELFAAQGAGVSLAEIASRAGVSKGALTHHFPSRHELEQATLAEGAQRFWDEVHSHVDLSENRPGKLLRGYVRALTADSELMRQLFSSSYLMQLFGSEQSQHNIFEQDATSWREVFANDGIAEGTSLAVRFAAEGLAASIGSPYLNPRELELARRRLLELSEIG